MKKQSLGTLIRDLALVGFVAIMPESATAVPTPQPSENAIPAVAYCANEVLPSIPQANLGECTSYIIIPWIAFSTHECDAWLEIDPASFYAQWDSYSQCVRELRGTF